MIAHRLSTLEKCDQVLVLREGHLTSVASNLQQARRELLSNPEQPVGPILGPVLVR
jgi:ABC-type bacteriocin/lantibiotic exporter with double-glycine peptidase domain